MHSGRHSTSETLAAAPACPVPRRRRARLMLAGTFLFFFAKGLFWLGLGWFVIR